jgi:hypothetical protein
VPGRRSFHGEGPPRSAAPLAVAAVLVAALLGGCSGGSDGAALTTPGAPERRRSAEPAQPPAGSLPEGLRRLPAGTVRVEPGPFTDRVRVEDLRIERGARPVVSGRLVNLVDVSDVLALELAVRFYDRRGRPVASGRRVFDHAESFHDRPLTFRIEATRPAATAVAALLTIPQLVNE